MTIYTYTYLDLNKIHFIIWRVPQMAWKRVLVYTVTAGHSRESFGMRDKVESSDQNLRGGGGFAAYHSPGMWWFLRWELDAGLESIKSIRTRSTS